MAKRSFLMLLFVLVGLTATAQKISVSGIIWDGSADESLPAAQVALLTAKDSTQMAAAISDAEGKFSIPYMKKGDYILRVTYFGFQTLYKNLTLDKSERKMDLGKLVMKENSKLMKEAEITANVAKVEIVADTFMYNADAYKLPEGSNLEELVRQIPGAEIDENGGLKINGKSVSKILMKGKEFFSGDTEMALKNLPSKVVQKVKAYDRKSDYSRITGIDDGEEETVLDLTVKRGMGEGWLMNVDAGAGKAVQDKIPNETEQIKFPVPLYTGKVDLNHYDDQLQLTFFGNRNNNNNGAGRWGGFGGGSGVTTTTMVGLNVTWTNGLEKYTGGYMEVGGNVRWNGRESENMTVSNREMYLNNQSSSFSNSRNWNRNKNNNINADLRLEWMVDSLTSIIFRPSFSHSESDGQSRGTSVTFNDDPYKKTTNPLADFEDDNLFAGDETRVNSNKSESRNNSNGNNGNMNLQVNRRLGKPGRNVTVDVNGSFNKNDNESFNWNKINYYQQNNVRLQDRYTMSPSESWHAQGRLSYTEPITDYLNLQFSYQYQRRFSDNDRSMFDLDRLIGETNGGQPIDEAFLYDIFANGINLSNAFAHGLDWQQLTLDALNSQYATYKENNHNAQVLLRFNKRLENDQEIRLNAGLNAQPQHTLMHYEKGSLDTTVTRNTFNWAPRVDFRWKINNVSQFRFGYNARMSQPSMTQLMEVTDDSNPLNVNTGNAGLRSSWNNNVNIEYNGYRMENQMSWFIRANYGNTKNSISSATIYDSNTGARYTRPMNINGNWNANINLNFNTAMGEKKYWNIMNNLSVSYNYRLGYLSNNNGGSQLDLHYTPEGVIDMDDLFSQVDLTQFEAATKTTGVTDWLRLNYRKSFGDDWNVDLGANAGGMFNSTRSTSNTASNIDTWMFGYGFNATIMFPWSISLRTDITQQSRRGYNDKTMDRNELLWNATLQKSFLKENAATISIEWNDILHQRTNVSRAIDAFSRTDTYTNNINSYFMCHFIYRLNLLGSKEARGMMNGFGFGGGGGNWGGGRGGNGGPGGGRGGFGGGGRF